MLEEGLREIFSGFDLDYYVARQGSAFCTYFMDHVPVDYHDILANHDFDFDRKYRLKLIEKGVFNFPLPIKQGSISYAHTADDIEMTLQATDEVMSDLAKSRSSKATAAH